MKNILRTAYKVKRKELSEKEIHDLSVQIAKNLISLLPDKAANIHTFLPIAKLNEVDTNVVMAEVKKEKPYFNWIISQADFDTYDLYHYFYNEKTKLRENHYGIPEPIDGEPAEIDTFDIVLVPLLAFDKKGKRIGYGKGFYDRFMALCPWKCRFIGLSFFEVSETLFQADEWDVNLHYCATPTKNYGF